MLSKILGAGGDPFQLIFKILLVVGLAVLVYFRRTEIAALFSGSITDQDLINTYGEGVNPAYVTLSRVEVQQCAETLKGSMGGWFQQDDEDSIYQTFARFRSLDDLLAVVYVAGLKDGATIIEQLRRKLSSTERGRINQILSDNLIEYAV